jgi:N-acetylmuramoyl-L-alanine amidase
MKSMIVMHHSASHDGLGVNAQEIRRWHKDAGWSDTGYQFLIEMVNGRPEMLAGRGLMEAGAHCRHDNMNSRSVGVCVVGNYEITVPSEELLLFTARHVRNLCQALNITPTRKTIVGHGEVKGASTLCPGKHFPLDTLVRYVRLGR